MSDSETAAQTQLIRNARQLRDELVRAFAAAGQPEAVSATCERAAVMVDRYCSDLLHLMLTTLPPSTEADAAWLRTQYLTLIVEFGSAIRDAIADSETRHAAAQGLQYRVLEHERHLKPALDSALANPPAVDIKPKNSGASRLPPESYLSRTGITRV